MSSLTLHVHEKKSQESMRKDPKGKGGMNMERQRDLKSLVGDQKLFKNDPF